MSRQLGVLLSLYLVVVACALASAADPQAPDILLIMKNGAEVRGVFVELKDGEYSLRLADGRLMRYPASGVASMKRLAGPEPQTPAPTTQSNPAVDPSSCRMFVTEKDIDKSLYTGIKDIKVSKKWYGSTAEMFGDLAAKARKIRADAVINVRTWHSPSGFAWAAPHAGGMAVKWTDAGRKALPTLEGRCYGADPIGTDDEKESTPGSPTNVHR